MKQVKLEIYTPKDYIQPLISALSQIGACNVGAYSHVSSYSEVSGTWIKSWLGRTPEIREKVRKVMMRELNTIDITGKNLVTMDVIVQYVMKTLSADLELLKRSGRGSFRIIGLEKYFRIRYDGFTIHGIVDRIDSFSDGEIRVVDYKTGNVDDRELAALYGPPSRTAEAVYHSATKKQRPGIAFQLYIYDKFMSEDPVLSGYSLSNAVYSTRRLFRELPDTCRVAGDFVPEMDSGLSELFREMTDISVPFRLTDDTDVCRNCDFKSICGR